MYSLYLLDASASGGFLQGPYSTFILTLMIILTMWLFLLRPQAKRAKSQKTFVDNLVKGDKIVTIAGIHGTVNKVNEDGTTLQLETSPGSYLKIEKSAISMDWTTALNKQADTEKK